MFSDEAGFWIGKTSLRAWRQLALDQLEEDEEETKHNNCKMNGERSSSLGNRGTDDNLKSNSCILIQWIYLYCALFVLSWRCSLLLLKLMDVKGITKKGTVKRWRTLMKTFYVITVCVKLKWFSIGNKVLRTASVSSGASLRCLFLSLSGGLSILESDRRLVSAEVWNKLRVYFPKAPEFAQQQHEPCQHCTVTATGKIN